MMPSIGLGDAGSGFGAAMVGVYVIGMIIGLVLTTVTNFVVGLVGGFVAQQMK